MSPVLEAAALTIVDMLFATVITLLVCVVRLVTLSPEKFS